MRQPYQSFVPMQGDSIAAIFEHYLTLSEQHPNRLVLAANDERAVGLLLQKLPESDAGDADGWNRIQHLISTLKADEQLAHTPLDLLRRLFPQEDIRVFAPRPVEHHCPEDWEKIHATLRSLGRAECEAILRDESHAHAGCIHIRDDICNRDYLIKESELDDIFNAVVH